MSNYSIRRATIDDTPPIIQGMACDRQGDFPIGKGFYMNDFIYALDI